MINVHPSTACHAIHRVTSSLARHFDEFVSMPFDAESLALGKERFFWIAGFPHVSGCVDGTHIPMKAPSDREWEFVNRE